MNKPIGVIDSGVGGLTVAKQIIRQLPKEDILYLGDTARCPYGSRPYTEIRDFTWEMTNFLMEKDIKMLVIACNTATSVVLNEMREKLQIPVIGVVRPGARAAIKLTQNDQIGVIGTNATINSKAYHSALKRINDKVIIEGLACPEFAGIVENGDYNKPEIFEIVKHTLAPLIDSNIDTLILGCTHYPLLSPIIQKVMGPSIQLISSGDETALEVSAILDQQNILSNSEITTHEFFTTGDPTIFSKIASSLFQEPMENVKYIKL
ncbi:MULTISPECIES: glutamate racemase [Bacillaceae]|uniref:Glutamate racemase n=1 Tax=Gottfriedia luciferensis TaxID=178774 RepID=A0ABX2ZKV8_9BACI|nr:MULTISPECIES: glutamate racemase [Bacillaceae]ODG90346.1 glutamate racemase [Gottfriedia luciferensis]PGZ93790.1 glutamate racemase [Bacillus sp. AFS029533]